MSLNYLKLSIPKNQWMEEEKGVKCLLVYNVPVQSLKEKQIL